MSHSGARLSHLRLSHLRPSDPGHRAAPRRDPPRGAATRRRDPPQTDDAGLAMLFCIVFILFIGCVLMLLLSQVVTEVRQTQFASKHEQTVNTAVAGLNAGLNELRNSIDTTGDGVIAYLPCTSGSNHGSIAGTVDIAGNETWQASIYYLNVDPSDLTPTDVGALAAPCPLSSVPKYAYLVSSGSQPTGNSAPASTGDRTLHATYDFSTTNLGKPGGQVVYGTNCWDAGSTPAIGSLVTFQPCLAADTPSQLWFYRGDLSIQWVGTPSSNLCLDYRAQIAGVSPMLMTLQTCIGNGQPGSAYDTTNHVYPLPNQMYQEYSLANAWKNVSTTGDAGGNCINTYNPSTGVYSAGGVGDDLVIYSGSVCSGSGPTTAAATSGVGPGMAGGVYTGLPGPTQQLVNLAYASRCLDLNGGTNPANGLINYPCHQAPDPSKIQGNQGFQYYGTTTSTGIITTSRQPYYGTVCFQSTGSIIQLVACVAGTAAQQWTMTGKVPGSYYDSYQIRDYLGKCLTAGNPGASLVGNITIQACNGTNPQRWNAPPGGVPTQLRSYVEH